MKKCNYARTILISQKLNLDLASNLIQQFNYKIQIMPSIKLIVSILIVSIVVFSHESKAQQTQDKDGWMSLFDGKSLKGWKVGENASSFRIEKGSIVANGPKAHLFYDGNIENHTFKNFEFKTRVMTTPGSNSGIYFHTVYQQENWPDKGFEVQVNNSQSDWKRTGSLYDIQNVKEVYVKDNEWFTEHIIVRGQRVIIKINDIVVIDYTEPANPLRAENHAHRLIDRGTFAFQAHDPNSLVYFKDIMVKILED